MEVVVVLERIRRSIGNASRTYQSTCTFDQGELVSTLTNLRRIRSRISDETYHSLHAAINALLTLPQENLPNKHYSAQRIKQEKGRPVVDITRQQLLLFFQEGYTAKRMAKHFACSKSVIYKRLYEERINLRSKYSNIDDETLREKINDLHKKHPNSGSVIFSGFLQAEGIVVQRRWLRLLLNELDPVGVAKRWSSSLKRRTYNVPAPNSLWHMDAHLKLSRWGFVTHGCIDGYSRMVVYLSCVTSIQAEPVVQLFSSAVSKHGLPSRVRSDHGYENIFVAILMNLLRGTDRGSHITGKSVHNQRIERLWRDVYKDVDVIYNEIYSLEDNGLLDPDNVIHRYSIQHVYLNIINARLASFMEAWNCHKIRTASNRSPRQIWLDEMLENCNANYVAISEVFNPQSDILVRVRQSLQQYVVDDTIINFEIEPSEASAFTAVLNLTEVQKGELDIISQNNLLPKEKYLRCIQCLSI